MKILYVEDNPVNLSLIERIAQMNKHELTSYDEAEVALVELEKGLDVDLILLDIQLAGEMDGIGLAKAIRQRGWQQPIIAITAYAMMGDKERILEAGCNEYLPKPLPIAEFLTLLAKYDPTNMPPPSETPPAEAPKAETPPAEAPKAETSPAEAPKAETPPAEAPKAETPPAEAPKTAPLAEAPKVETPAEVPKTAPLAEVPKPPAEAPKADGA